MPTMTGYGLRYKGRLISNDGNVYQALLWQADYDGSATVVRLAEDALTVEWGARGSDVYVPLLTSEAHLNGVQVTTELEDLIGANADDWRLEIYRGDSHEDIDNDRGTSIWLGKVLADIYEDSTTGEDTIINIEAIDGLGALEEILYYDTSSPPDRLPFSGRESYLTILVRALGKMGYSLPIRSALAWRPSSVGGAEDPLAELDVDGLSFYSPDGEAMNCYDIVEEIARVHGARLCQWEGAWWIVSREVMNGSTYTYFKYTSDGTPDGTGIEGTPVDTSTAVRELGGRRTFRSGFSAVAVQQNHGPIPPLIDEGLELGTYEARGRRFVTIRPVFVEGSWTYTGNGSSGERDARPVRRVGGRSRNVDRLRGGIALAVRNQAHTLPSYFHGTATDPDTVKAAIANGTLSTAGPHYAERTSATVDAGTFIQFTARVKIEHNAGRGDGRYTPYWLIKIAGTNHYLTNDGTWAQSANVADQLQFGVTNPTDEAKFGEYGIRLGSEEPISVISEATPATGPIVLRLYGTSDVDGTFLDPGDVIWDDVLVLVVDKTGETLASVRTEAYVVDSPEEPREDIQVITGAGPGVKLPTTQTDDGVEVSDWTSAHLATPRTLGEIHSETVLRHQTNPLESRHETYRNLGASMVAPIQVGSSNYVAQGLMHSFYHDIDQGEWVKVAWDGDASALTGSGSTDEDNASYMPVDIGGGGGVIEEIPETAGTIAVFLTEQRLEEGSNDDIWHIYQYDVDNDNLRRIRNGDGDDDSMEMNAISWRSESETLYRFQAQSGVGGLMLRTDKEGLGETIDGTLSNVSNRDHTIDEDRDRIYIAISGSPIIYAFATHGNDLLKVDVSRAWKGITYDGSRYLYIVDQDGSTTTVGEGTVQRFDLDTETDSYDGTFYYYQQDEIVADGLDTPYGIAVDGSFIYVLESDELIKRYALDGTGGTTLVTGTLSTCRNMALHDGFLWWVATDGPNGIGRVRRCALDGSGLETVLTIQGVAAHYIGLQGIDVATV